jgi:hypothetical protein
LHISSLTTLDPLLTLELRIDKERPSRALADDSSILSGDSIGLEALLEPLGNIGLVGKNLKRINTLGDRKTSLSNIS